MIVDDDRIEEFEFNEHYCMVMPLYGPSLYSVVKHNDFRCFSLSLIRDILREVRFI